MEVINERIGVLVQFMNGIAKPVIFSWRGRKYKIERISLTFDRKDGGRKILCFSVDTGGMMAELAMDRESFVWKIAKCEQSFI
jgi:hypothetical protein